MALGLALGLPLALAIAGLGGHRLARRALRPLDRMARHAERLTADNLDERLPVENPDDELGHLARVFNASLAKIEESFAPLRRFTADVSHELRTPLTAIRRVGEVGLGNHPSEQGYREIIGSILDEADRLTLLVDTLLTLSRADAGEVALHRDDEGPGIPPAHRERIFERFYRIDKARSRDQGGAGLGLALAQWAVTAHGGRIDVESTEGKGSTFRVSLPRAKPDSPGRAE